MIAGDPRPETHYIFYHHFVSGNYESIEKQLERLEPLKGDYSDSYHYVILTNGKVIKINDDFRFIGHMGKDFAPNNKPCNYNSIGICLMGNFQWFVPRKVQQDALARLTAEMMVKYFHDPLDTIDNVLRHKDAANTACPGRRFPIELIKEKTMYQLKPQTIVYKEGESTALVDGKVVTLGKEPINIWGSQVVGLRDIHEVIFDYEVGWDQQTQTTVMKLKGV